MRLSSDLFRELLSTKKVFNIRPSLVSQAEPTSRRPRDTKSDNQDVAIVSQDPIWLGPNLFWRLETDEYVLNTSVRNKENIVQKRKNTPVQLQGQLVPIETKEEKKSLAICIYLRRRIIHNIYKIKFYTLILN